MYVIELNICHTIIASFPDSTPQLFIAPYIKAGHGTIKSWGVESGNEANTIMRNRALRLQCPEVYVLLNVSQKQA